MSLSRAWEKFKGGPTRSSANDLRVTINRKGIIYMNARTFALMNRPQAVELHYNREREMMALVRASPNQQLNFPLVQRENGWVVQASSFCRHYGIRVAKTDRFVKPVVDGSGRLILELRETVNVSGVERKKKDEEANGEL